MSRLWGYVLICATLAFSGVYVAAQVDLIRFEPGTPARAADVNANFVALADAKQARVTGTCAEGSAIRVVHEDGGVECEADSGGGVDGEASSLPAGAVMSFNLPACPARWSAFTAGAGRTVVGVAPGGTLLGTVGRALGDLRERRHNHAFIQTGAEVETSRAGEHDHLWARITANRWLAGSGEFLFEWGNGIDNDGDGIKPIATYAYTEDYFTSADGAHTHTLKLPDTNRSTTSASAHLPYVQLLMCQKD